MEIDVTTQLFDLTRDITPTAGGDVGARSVRFTAYRPATTTTTTIAREGHTVRRSGFVLALGVLLIIGNTIRLAIENRRSEIEIVKLVGGTDSFVRRPFLYLGFWYGIGGALVAWVLVQGSLVFLSAPVETIAQSYRDDFALSGPGILDSTIILLAGTGLGVSGALLAVSRHLSDIEPE